MVGDFIPGEGVCSVAVLCAGVVGGEKVAWTGNGEVLVRVENVGWDWVWEGEGGGGAEVACEMADVSAHEDEG